MSRAGLGQIVSCVSTALSVAGSLILLDSNNSKSYGFIFLLSSFVTSMISYLIYRYGFKNGIRMVKKMSRIGWDIIPFPYNVFTFLVALTAGMAILFFLPIIPVRKAYLFEIVE